MMMNKSLRIYCNNASTMHCTVLRCTLCDAMMHSNFVQCDQKQCNMSCCDVVHHNTPYIDIL